MKKNLLNYQLVNCQQNIFGKFASPSLKRIFSKSKFLIFILLFVIGLDLSLFSQTPGNALSLDGSNPNYADVTDFHLGTGDFTIEAWIKPVYGPPNPIISNRYGGSSPNYYDLNIWWGASKGIVRFQTGYAGTATYLDLMSSELVESSTWNHIAVVRYYDGSNDHYTVYLNGRIILTQTENSSLKNYTPAHNMASIGDDGSQRFSGLIDEVRVWNIAKSQAEIQSAMDSLPVITADLVGYYPFNESSGSTVTDLSASNNTGAIWSGSGVWEESYAMVVPVAKQATNVTLTSFKTHWNAPRIGSFDNYFIDVAKDKDFTDMVPGYNNLDVGTVTSYDITGLTGDPGSYYFRVRAYKSSVGSGCNSNTVIISNIPANTLPWSENFEGPIFPPLQWAINNVDGGTVTWTRKDCGGNKAAFINFSNPTTYGKKYELISPRFNLTTSGKPILEFKVYGAYWTGEGSSNPQIDIFYSTDGGNTFNGTPIYDKLISEIVGYETDFGIIPGEKEWRIEKVDLLPFQSNDNLVFKFLVQNAEGDNVYIDDVNLHEATGTASILSFIEKKFEVTGVINEPAKTITLTFPSGTFVNNLDPDIRIDGMSVSPANSDPLDLSSTVDYIVASEDGITSKTYTVGAEFTTVTQATDLTAVYQQATNDVLIQWTNGSGAGRSVFMKEYGDGNADPSKIFPYTGANSNYTLSSFTPGGWHCVFSDANPINNSVIVTGLTAGKKYRIMVCEWDGSLNSYLTTDDGAYPVKNPVNYNNPLVINTYPYVQDFENPLYPPLGWSDNSDAIYFNWKKVSVGFTNAVYLNFFNEQMGGHPISEFISPVFDLTSLTSPILRFKVAYQTQDYYSDDFNVYISTDGGATFEPTPLYNLNDDSWPDNPDEFFASSPNDWKYQLIDLSAYNSYDQVVIKFEGTSDQDNNLFLDDVMVKEMSNTYDILTFKFDNQPLQLVELYSDEIDVTLPSGTDLSNLIPIITHNGYYVDPESGVPQDFSSGSITYSVRSEYDSEGNSTHDYDVYVSTGDIPASSVTFSNNQPTQVTINWIKGNGDGDLVFMLENGTGGADPIDGTTYTANSVYSVATSTTPSGWYCVYAGTGNSVTVTGLTPGSTYRVMVCEYFNGGSIRYVTSTIPSNPRNYKYAPTIATFPWNENFEGATQPPDGWEIQNPDEDYTWEYYNNGGNNTYFVNGWNYEYEGEQDELITPVFDLTSLNKPIFQFRVAHQNYDNYYIHTLKVMISTNGGPFTEIYNKSGSILASVPGDNDYDEFFPSGQEQWRLEKLNISAFKGNNVVLKFVSINGYGQNLFIDDINIHEALTTKDILSFIFANPLSPGIINANSIDVLVPGGTSLTSLVPTITHNGNSINPQSRVSRDFSTPVNYIVTAEDGTFKNYLVAVEVSTVTQSSDIQFTSITANSVQISCTNGTGDGRALFIKENGTGLPLASNGYLYPGANTVYTLAESTANGWKCITANMTGPVTVTGLNISANNSYLAMVCEYKNPANPSYINFANTGNPKNLIQNMTPPGNELTFDGLNTYITVNPGLSLNLGNSFTLESWVKISNINSNTGGYIFDKTGDYALWIDNNYLELDLPGSDDWLYINYNFKSDTWYHIAVTFDADNGGLAKFYVNGHYIGSYSGSGTRVSAPSNLLIGIDEWNNKFSGTVDEIRIWNLIRSQSEIQNAMHRPLTGSEPNLAAYYKFDADNGTILYDYSPNGNNGTLSGFSVPSCWQPSGAFRPFAKPASNISASGFTANWDTIVASPSTINGYNIEVATDNGFTNIIQTGSTVISTATSYPVSVSLNADQTYYYRLNAAIDGINTPYSDPVQLAFYTPPANALNFDGNDDYVFVNNTDPVTVSGSFTIESWVKPKSISGSQSILSTRSPSDNGFDMKLMDGNKIHGDIGDGTGWITTNADANFKYKPDVWIHIAYVVEPTTYNIYVNGILVGNGGYGTSSPLLIDGSHSISIGCFSPYNEQFNGSLDEIRIWNTARSQADIIANMNVSLAGNEPGLVAYYNFDQGIRCEDNKVETKLNQISTSNLSGQLNNFSLNSGDCTSNWVKSDAMCPILNEASNVSLSGFTVNWQPYYNSTKFRLDVSEKNDFSNLLLSDIDAGNGTSYNVSLAMTEGTPLYYRLRAETSGWTSPNSMIKSVMYIIPPGNALDFDGNDDYVQLKDVNLGTSDFTLEAWIKLNTSNETYLITNRYDEGAAYGNWFILKTWPGSRRFVLDLMDDSGPGLIELVSNSSLNLNEWYHVAVTREGATVNFYINGVLDNSVSAVSSANVTNPDNILAFGAWPGYGAYFQGQMDEVSIWNAARLQTDIQSDMFNPLVGNEANLVSYYNFDQGKSCGDNALETALFDTNISNNTGTLYNLGLADGSCTSNWVKSDAMRPVANEATSVTTTGFTANWNPIGGATDYLIDVSDNIGFTTYLQQDISTGVTTTFDLTGLSLTPGQSYYYRIRVKKGAWTSMNSLAVAFMYIAPPLGNALDFDGVDDYVDCGNSSILQAATNSITLEAWINASAWKPTIGEGSIINKEGVDGYILRCGDNGKINFNLPLSSGIIDLIANTALNINTWYHVAAVYDGAEIKIYVGGQLMASQAASGTITPVTYNLRIGSCEMYPDRTFAGKIDEVRVWNIARTLPEIQSNMYNYLVGNETGLVAYYRFDQGNASNTNTSLPNEVIDYTGNCNKGTLNGFDLISVSSNWVYPGNAAAPIITTTSASVICPTSEKVYGDIISNGKTNVTTRGFCYSTTDCPTIANTLTNETGTFAAGAYSLNLTGLTPNTTYYVRAYATNAQGTSYGETQSFTTPAALSFTTLVTNVQCFGGSTGSIEINATGGTPFYDYSIDNGNTWMTSNIYPGLTAGNYDLIVRDSKSCLSTPETHAVTQPTSAITFTATSNTVLCNGATGSVTLSYSGGTGTLVPSGPPTTGLTAGIYNYTVTDLNSCVANASATVVDNSTTPAIAGSNQTLCNQPYIMIANSPGGGETGTWSQTNPASPLASIGNINSPSTSISSMAGGTNYIFKWTISNGTCSSTSTVSILTNFSTTYAGADQTVCAGNQATMGAASPVPGTGVWVGPGSIALNSSPSTLVTSLPPNANTFTWTVINAACGTSSDDVVISNYTPSTPNATTNKTTCCSPTEILLTTSVPTYGTGSWSAVNTTGQVVSAGSNNWYVQNLIPGANTFRWTVKYHQCTLYKDININLQKLPAFAGNDKFICADSMKMEANSASPGIGQWTVMSGSGSFVNPNGEKTTLKKIGRGRNIYKWTITNGTCVTNDSVIIDNFMVIANAGQDQTVCTDTSTIRAIPDQYPGSWTTSSGASIANRNMISSKVTSLSEAVNKFVWTVSNNLCTSADTVNVDNSKVYSFAGTDRTVCSDTVLMTATVPSRGSGIWIFLGTSALISNISDPGTKVTKLSLNKNDKFIWRVNKNQCFAQDTVSILNGKLTAIAGNNQSVCSDKYVMTADLPGRGTGLWTTVGNVIIIDPKNNHTPVEKLALGSNPFTWTVSDNFCKASSQIYITNNLPVVNAGEDFTVCNTSVNLKGNAPTTGTGIWIVTGGSASIVNPQDPATQVNGLKYGDNKFVWTIRANNCINSDTVNVVGRMLIANAGGGQTVCTSTAVLNALKAINGTGAWSYNGNALIGTRNLNITPVSNLAHGDNVFMWYVTNKNCSSSEYAIIKNFEVKANAGADQVICIDSTLMKAIKPLYGAGTWNFAGSKGIMANLNDPFSLYTRMPLGINTLTWLVKDHNCSSIDSVIITNQMLKANAGPDKVVCTDTTFLEGKLVENGKGKWTSKLTTVVIDDSNNAFSPVRKLNLLNNVFTWTLTNQYCTSSDDVVIKNYRIKAEVEKDKIVCFDTTHIKGWISGNQGKGSWISRGTSVLSNAAVFEPLVSKLVQGKNLFTWKVNNEFCKDSANLTVQNDNVKAILSSFDTVVCTNEVRIVAQASQYGAGLWTSVDGLKIPSPESPENLVSGLKPGPNKFIWKVQNQNCKDSIGVIIQNKQVKALVEEDKVICENQTDIKAEKPAQGTGKWTQSGNNPVIDNPSVNDTKLSRLNFGLNKFVWTVSLDKCLSSDTLLVTNKNTGTDAGRDTIICSDATVLNGKAAPGSVVKWEIFSGSATIVNPANLVTEIQKVGLGKNIFVLTASNDKCTRTDTVTITSRMVKAHAFAGSHAVCVDSVMVYGERTPMEGSLGMWTTRLGTGTVSKLTETTFLARGLSSGDNVFTWTVKNENCQASEDVKIINNRLDANFAFQSKENSSEYQFFGISSGKPGNWQWNFGDDTETTGNVVSHTFLAENAYNVCLTVYDERTGCNAGLCKRIDVGKVNCRADFSYKAISENDSTIEFTNLSLGDVTNYSWKFDDGSSSTEKNPKHTFPRSAVYNVCLVAANKSSGCVSEVCELIKVGQPTCSMVAKFDYFFDGSNVSFKDMTQGRITSWYWEFGDQSTSAQKDPIHKFPSFATYTIRLSVYDSLLKCAGSYVKQINLKQPECNASFNFYYSPDDGKQIIFQNLSTGKINKYYWNFDDNSSSGLRDVIHNYTEAKVYKVELVVSDTISKCRDFAVMDIPVGVVDCDARFDYFVDSVATTVYFFNKPLKKNSLVYWQFGDGSKSTEINPIHRYPKPGYYDVTLTTYNETSQCMDYNQMEVLVSRPGNTVSADFNFQIDENGQKVFFFNTSEGNDLTSIWNFDDDSVQIINDPVHYYKEPGYYNVCLSVYNKFGATDIECEVINVPGPDNKACNANFIYTVDEKNKIVNFKDISNGNPDWWQWNFGDDGTSESQNPGHLYKSDGLYKVHLQIKNNNNQCSDHQIKYVNVSKEEGLFMTFSYILNNIFYKSGGYPTDFMSSSFGTPAKAVWDFGDGTKDSTSLTPNHVYKESGTYKVCLIATDPVTGVKTTTCQEVIITAASGISSTTKMNASLSNYPNPFSKITYITYLLTENTRVELGIYDVLGHKVDDLVNHHQQAGIYTLEWNKANTKTGIYFLRLMTPKGSITKKMVISE